MTFSDFDTVRQKASIHSFAQTVMTRYPLDTTSIECVNFEFNATFKVSTTTGDSYALRININSNRSMANLSAEVDFVHFLQRNTAMSVPSPIPMKEGKYFGSEFHEDSKRTLNFVLYTWLLGQEIGDSPKLDQIRAIGILMAKMHDATKSFSLSNGSSLESLRDPLWGQSNNVYGPTSSVSKVGQEKISSVISKVDSFLDALYSSGAQQAIHADLHGWNVLEHLGSFSVLDFDDCAMGYPLQDLATTLYYLDNEEQDNALLEGYESIRPLPVYRQEDMALLLLQRRIVLLNYLLETSTPHHRELIPNYFEETLRRIDEFIAKYPQ